jgi:FkbM family methyltransferase
MNLNGFDWGSSNEWYKTQVGKEFEEFNVYNKFFDVEAGDVVMDLGASIGPFSYSIKNKSPKHIFCIEPSSEQIPTLTNNLQGAPYTLIPKGISRVDGVDTFELYGNQIQEGQAESISFSTLIKDYNIERIDFLKTDCEGGEYSFFTPENIWWIKNNVKKIVGEFHLSTPELKQQFREFRDVYLKLFPNHQIHAVCGADVKWDLWNDHFIEYYNEIIIYIDNR